MRVAFVVPRYGPTVIGGAESAARALAEHLVARKSWEVQVLTGCAEDFVTWADVLPAGEETVNGVQVRRFASAAGRDPSFHPYSASLLSDPACVSVEEAERWIDLQGPVVPDVVEAAAGSDVDALVLYPYLYYPTVRLIDRVRTPTVLHPAAHDEPALRLPVFPRVFGAADGLVFQTAAERDLVQRMFPVATHHQLLLGLGVDDPADIAGGSSGHSPEEGDPYLVCLGRVDRHKGTSLLAGLFTAYKERHPGPLRLVLAGPVVEAPESHPAIDVVGPVSEEEKWALLHGALALVSPSPWEAFSLVIAEAWSARVPVVVNAECAATVEHCNRSGGGLSFAGFGEFEAVLDLLCTKEGLRTQLGDRGRAYVDRWFRWPRIIDRYATFVETVVATAARSQPVAQRSRPGTRDHVDAEHGRPGEDAEDPESADRQGSGHRQGIALGREGGQAG
jgi:glycosyltransferase involved in cell wall biosynthesis